LPFSGSAHYHKSAMQTNAPFHVALGQTRPTHRRFMSGEPRSPRVKTLNGLLLLAGFGLLFGGRTSGAELLARGVLLPTYVAGIAQPVVITRVALMEKDYYQQGFLQFGVLPITVGRGVVMEVRQPDALGAALEGIQEWKRAPGRGRAMELRTYSLHIPLPEGRRELTAGRVRFGEKGQLVLAQGVIWKEADGTIWEAEQATLQITGVDTGRLVLQVSSGPMTRQIFGQANLPAEETRGTKQAGN